MLKNPNRSRHRALSDAKQTSSACKIHFEKTTESEPSMMEPSAWTHPQILSSLSASHIFLKHSVKLQTVRLGLEPVSRWSARHFILRFYWLVGWLTEVTAAATLRDGRPKISDTTKIYYLSQDQQYLYHVSLTALLFCLGCPDSVYPACHSSLESCFDISGSIKWLVNIYFFF